VADNRARAFVRYVEDTLPSLRLCQELRHHAVHRTLLEAAIHQSGSLEDEKLTLSASVLGVLKNNLIEMGEPPASWGIANERGPETISVSVVKAGGVIERHDRKSAGSASLDPLPFAVHLTALVARHVDTAFRLIDFASDPRVPATLAAESVRILEQRGEMFNAENARIAILSGPLSGLVG